MLSKRFILFCFAVSNPSHILPAFVYTHKDKMVARVHQYTSTTATGKEFSNRQKKLKSTTQLAQISLSLKVGQVRQTDSQAFGAVSTSEEL